LGHAKRCRGALATALQKVPQNDSGRLVFHD
jgi:hypothetical protein